MGKKSVKSRKGQKGGFVLETAVVVGIPHVVNVIGSCLWGAGVWLVTLSPAGIVSAAGTGAGALATAATAAPGVIASGAAALPGALTTAGVALAHTTAGVFTAAPGVLSTAGQGLIAGGTALANTAYVAGGIALVAGLATLSIESFSNFMLIVSEFEKDGHIAFKPQVEAYILNEPLGENNTFKSIAERDEFVKKLISVLYLKLYITDQCGALYLDKIKDLSEQAGIVVEAENMVPTFSDSQQLGETIGLLEKTWDLDKGAINIEKINKVVAKSLGSNDKIALQTQNLLMKVEEAADQNRENKIQPLEDIENIEVLPPSKGGRRRRRRRRRTKKI